jgi:hypothetical protein
MCSPSRRAGPTARAALASPPRTVGSVPRAANAAPSPHPGRPAGPRPGVRYDIPDPAAVKTFPSFLETAA